MYQTNWGLICCQKNFFFQELENLYCIILDKEIDQKKF
jgi:hypothetical protein